MRFTFLGHCAGQIYVPSQMKHILTLQALGLSHDLEQSMEACLHERLSHSIHVIEKTVTETCHDISTRLLQSIQSAISKRTDLKQGLNLGTLRFEISSYRKAGLIQISINSFDVS